MRWAPLFPVLLFSVASVHGVDNALQPLRDGVPSVAVVKLKERLKGTLEPEEERAARVALAEALLAAGNPAEALVQARSLEEPLLRARIEAALGHWEEVLAAYDTLDSAAAPGLEQTLGRAEALRHLGRTREAIEVLESSGIAEPALRLNLAELYLEKGDLQRCEAVLKALDLSPGAGQKRRLYLEARLFLAQNQPAFAYERFETLQREPHALAPELLIGSLLGMSDALAQLNGLTAADNVVEKFLWQYPEAPRLDLVFQKLDEIYAGEKDSSDSELQKLSQREPALRAGYATYYLARMTVRAGKLERALRFLNPFAERFPKHPVLADALLLQGELLARTGAFEAAQKSFDAAMRASSSDRQRAEIEMASATAYFHAREFVLAATVFRSVGERAPSLWQRAVFNSALSWLHQGNFPRFLEDYKELSRRFPESPYRRELILEEGLLQARQGSPQAEATLRQFLRDFPDNPRVPEAQLALAEIRFAGGDMGGAAQYLKATHASAEAPAVSEQSAYLAIFVADAASPRDDAKVAELGREFLEKHPASARKAEVRMKLGQIFFRQANFAGAQTEFETLAREEPESPLAAPALFLAGQASMKSMGEGGVDHAIGLFEEVARRDGGLKGYARLQQALAQNQLGKQKEAILLYDAILDGNPTSSLRFAALAGKAENLAELGAKDRASCEQALALFEQLAADPEITPLWRGQALYKKGRCLEELKRPDEALAAYYDVLQAGVAHPEEYFWFYKAGFDAGRLSESRAEWKSAVGIYRKIAAQDGPRAEEAKAQAEELRLKHFIWE